MVNYRCQRCDYETINKTMFKRHLLRKNVCKPKLNEISRYTLLLTNGFDEEALNYKESPKCHTFVNPDVNPNVNKKGLHFCENCNKEFTTRQGKSKHKKLFCKQKESDLTLLKTLLAEKDKLITKILNENKKESDKKKSTDR